MPLSLAEHARTVVGIDPIDRFSDAGVRLARERRLTALHFARADGMALRSPTARSIWCCLMPSSNMWPMRRGTWRVPAGAGPGGRCYLSTAPYLSFAGAHLPACAYPFHSLDRWPDDCLQDVPDSGQARTVDVREPAHENSFIRDARLGIDKHDDLLEKVRVVKLRGQIASAGLRVVREELHVTSTVRRLPAPIARWIRDSPLTQDALISNIEYVLGAA